MYHYDYISFVSNQPGTVTVGSTIYDQISYGENLWHLKVGNDGPSGMIVTSSVPVWAVIDYYHGGDEQLLW